MIKDLSNYDVSTFRGIIFHGKHSMRDMNLMMIGSTPLSQLLPKTVREEIAYTDGDLDLSRIDGATYFQSREIEYSFVFADEYYAAQSGTTLDKNKNVTSTLNSIYTWLYNSTSDYTVKKKDIYGPDTTNPDLVLGAVTKDEMFDYAYGLFKFTGASVESVQTSKAIMNDVWLTQVTVKFKMDPRLQSLAGARLDLASFVDLRETSRGVQTALVILNLNKYFLNDFDLWTNECTISTATKWRYRIRIPYTGRIGLRLSMGPIVGETQYNVSTATGATWVGDPWQGGKYGYVTPTTDSSGYHVVELTVTFTDSYTVENKPYIHVEWGVIKNYSVPDHDHYIMTAYTKSNSAELHINSSPDVTPFAEPFSIDTSRSINELHVTNPDYDGLYKLRYDSTTRRL